MDLILRLFSQNEDGFRVLDDVGPEERPPAKAGSSTSRVSVSLVGLFFYYKKFCYKIRCTHECSGSFFIPNFVFK